MQKTAVLRPVRKVWRSRPTIEGAGVHLKRAFGFNEVPQFDPFLMLDDFRSEDPEEYRAGFPWHPHRGMETITYVLDGEVEHRDSLGNGGAIASGDVQWMTAGSGILHQEMPKGDRRGRITGFQLWANLPAKDKLTAPRYRGVRGADIPAVKVRGGALVRVVAGEVQGTRGPVRDILTDPEVLDVSLPAGSVFEREVKPGHTVFAYVVEGDGWFDPEEEPPAAGKVSAVRAFGPQTLVLYGPGDTVRVAAAKRAVRFLLVSGRPLDEPVAWYGPIVMNTEAELRTAIEELEAGTFVKEKAAGR